MNVRDPAYLSRRRQNIWNCDTENDMPTNFCPEDHLAPASAQGIAAFEAAHRILLPPSYKEFLATQNGGSPEPSLCVWEGNGDLVSHFYGIHDGPEWTRLDVAVNQFGHDLSEFLPIAVSNGGNYFLLCLAGHDIDAVYFWDHELEDMDPPTFTSIIRVASSLQEFIDSLQHEPPEDLEQLYQ